VLRTNDAVVEKPEIVNSDPRGDGWLVEVRLSDASEIDNLLSAADYDALIAAEDAHRA
jgi:glycine cleavage system H protein